MHLSEQDAKRIAQFTLYSHKSFIAQIMREYAAELQEGCHSQQQFEQLGAVRRSMVDIYNRLIGNVTIAEPENIFEKPGPKRTIDDDMWPPRNEPPEPQGVPF